MDNREGQPRRSARRLTPEEARARYRASAPTKTGSDGVKRQMTYDDYLAHVKDAEKLIEIDDESRWTSFKEGVSDYFNWLDDKREILGEKTKQAFTKDDDGQTGAFWRALTKLRVGFKKLILPLEKRVGAKNLRYATVTGITVLVLYGGFGLIFGGAGDEIAVDGQNRSSPSVQGAASDQEDLIAVESDDDLAFEMLFPGGASRDDYDVVLISPQGADPAYTYLDQVNGPNGPVMRVTQQVVPAEFSLADVATGFNATEEIQVDDITIYHGYASNENVQSLLFIKSGLLVTIRSSGQLPDDVWAAYVANLQ